jgi:hypothetical protein
MFLQSSLSVPIVDAGDKVDAVTVVFGQIFQHMDMHHK